MKIALVGEPKVGKDWFACTAPGSIFTFDFDKRLDSLNKHPNRANIEGKTYFDDSFLKPLSWNQFVYDVQEFQEMHKKGEKIPDWFITSSMQFMSDCCMNTVLVDNPGMRQELRTDGRSTKDIKRKGELIGYLPFGWDPYTLVCQQIEEQVNALNSIGNVICVFHEAPEKDIALSTPKEPVYTGRLQVYPNNLKKLLPLFNDQWRLSIFGGERHLTTDISDSKFVAATSLLIDGDIKNPNLSEMIKEHEKRMKNG